MTTANKIACAAPMTISIRGANLENFRKRLNLHPRNLRLPFPYPSPPKQRKFEGRSGFLFGWILILKERMGGVRGEVWRKGGNLKIRCESISTWNFVYLCACANSNFSHRFENLYPRLLKLFYKTNTSADCLPHFQPLFFFYFFFLLYNQYFREEKFSKRSVLKKKVYRRERERERN